MESPALESQLHRQASKKIVEDLVDTNLIQLDTETTACYADQDDDIIFEDFARLRLKGETDAWKHENSEWRT